MTSTGSGTSTARANIVFTVGLLAACALLWFLRDLVLLIYASVLFAVLIGPLVERIARWHIGRGGAIAVVVVGGALILVLVLSLLLPPIISEISGLIAAWPLISGKAIGALQEIPGLHHFDFSHLETHLSQAGPWALAAAQSLAGAIADGFTVLLLTIYLIVDGQAARKWCLSFFEPDTRQRISLTLDRGERRMRGWLLGQSLLALILAAASAIVFALLQVPYFYVLALLTGLLSFVPILGQVAAAAITATVAGVNSWEKMVGVLIFFGIYQVLDNGYLTPTVMRDAVDVPGLAIIIALAIGASLGGVLGAALAVPSAALVAELITEFGHH